LICLHYQQVWLQLVDFRCQAVRYDCKIANILKAMAIPTAMASACRSGCAVMQPENKKWSGGKT